MLVQCTGGHSYYVELRGASLKRAAYCINRCKRQNRPTCSAYEEAWGEPYEWGTDEHTFGARCVYTCKVNKRIGGKMEAVYEVGIWVGRNLTSNEHWIVPLSGYNPHSGEYDLGKIVSVRTMRVFNLRISSL